MSLHVVQHLRFIPYVAPLDPAIANEQYPICGNTRGQSDFCELHHPVKWWRFVSFGDLY
jgi:hypothetical protein